MMTREHPDSGQGILKEETKDKSSLRAARAAGRVRRILRIGRRPILDPDTAGPARHDQSPRRPPPRPLIRKVSGPCPGAIGLDWNWRAFWAAL